MAKMRMCIDGESCIEVSSSDAESAYAIMSIAMRGVNKEWGEVVKELSNKLKRRVGGKLSRDSWTAVLSTALQAFSYAYRGWSYTVAYSSLIHTTGKAVPRGIYEEVVRIGWCFGVEVRRKKGGRGAEDKDFRRDYEERCLQSRQST
jgi:hypothetical protein